MLTIQNSSIRLEIDLQQQHLAFIPLDSRFPLVKGIDLGISYRGKNRQNRTFPLDFTNIQEERSVIDTTEHGRIEILRFSCLTAGPGVEVWLTLGITEEHPFILWKLGIHNRGNDDLYLRRINMLCVKNNGSGGIIFPAAQNLVEKGFHSHGWQSWSLSASYRADEQMETSRLYQLQTPMIYYSGTPVPHKRGVFTSDMFAVIGDRKARTGFLVGFLAQKEQFGSIRMDFNTNQLEMWANGDGALLPPGGEMITDWAVFTPILLDHRAPLEQYLEAVGRENHARTRVEVPPGWCSWYHYYTNLSSRDVEDNLQKIVNEQERVPLQLVQIDDGYETRVGDWFSFTPEFPQGVQPLAEKISKMGLMPGLWQAPFAVHPRSNLMLEHPDWILRNASGTPVNAGFGWDALFTGLDLTNPEALEYACRVVRTAARVWEYPYLKLDFLYAAALPGRYKDLTKTRAQVLRMGMEALRVAMGEDTLLLGCGLPLGSGIGIVDAMRISADVSGNWYPIMFGVGAMFRKEPAMPCARNSVRNTINRAWQHRTWWTNDPDCLLVRPDSNLTLAEVQSMATVIGMTGGMLLLSDDLTRVPEERLRIAAQLIPSLQEPVRVIDWFEERIPTKLRLDMIGKSGSWQIISLSNWSDRTQKAIIKTGDYFLEPGEYLYREFWSGKIGRMISGEDVDFGALPPHGSLLLAVRKVSGQDVIYLGSDLHFSQGSEVGDWSETKEEVQVTLRLPRAASGRVFFYSPGAVSSVTVDGEVATLQQERDHIYSIPVTVQGFAHVDIKKGSGG